MLLVVSHEDVSVCVASVEIDTTEVMHLVAWILGRVRLDVVRCVR